MKRSLFVVFCLATMVYAVAAYAADGFADCVEMQCPLEIAGSSETYSVLGQDAPVVTGTIRHVMNVMEIGRFIIVIVVKVDIHTVQKRLRFRNIHPRPLVNALKTWAFSAKPQIITDPIIQR